MELIGVRFRTISCVRSLGRADRDQDSSMNRCKVSCAFLSGIRRSMSQAQPLDERTTPIVKALW